MFRFLMKLYYLVTMPASIFFIVHSPLVHPSYKMPLWKRYLLGLRMFLNRHRVQTATSFKSHLVMAMKILQSDPSIPGDIIECGTWKGGSAVNLSLVCKAVGRKLLIYDSFEGLPAGEAWDREAKYYQAGDYCGTLNEVRENIRRYGDMDSCEFIKGWFNQTLPGLNRPILLAFLDVDLEASLETCVAHIWPALVPKGYIFIDEFIKLDYCALFYSESFWKRQFNRTPPGLIGAGSGLALGEYYVGPESEMKLHPLQHATAGGYTRKDFSGVWGSPDGTRTSLPGTASPLP
jgi:O-methyltransferase